MWRQRSGAATPCRSEGGDPLKGPRQAVGDPAQTAGPVTSWREAAGVAAQPEPEDGAALTTDHTRSNWLWVADLTRWDRAPDIQGGGVPATAWGRHFGFVHHLELASAGLDFARVPSGEAETANIAVARASPGALPFRDEAFDCVIWEGALQQWGTTTRRSDLTAGLRGGFAARRPALSRGGVWSRGVPRAAWR